MSTAVESFLLARAQNLLAPITPLLYHYHVSSFYLAGNSLNGTTVHDLDLWSPSGWHCLPSRPKQVTGAIPGLVELYDSDRAKTVDYQGNIVQFCYDEFPSMLELACSFDWAHVEVGVHIRRLSSFMAAGDDHHRRNHSEVFCSDNWELSRLIGQTWFTSNTDFPANSLFRMGKYLRYESDGGPRVMVGPSIIAILIQIGERGFHSIADVEEQLAGISEGVPIRREQAQRLLDLFHKNSPLKHADLINDDVPF
jgi:hypothetical protein